MAGRQQEGPDMLEPAGRYTRLGWIIQPLYSPQTKRKVTSPGKQPIETRWQKRTTPRTEAEIKKFWGPGQREAYNIGLQCGERSGVLVIDVDDWNPAIWDDLTAGLNAEAWLMSNRTKGRRHIFFKFTDALKACKHHDLGIEILSNGNNAVLPPSKHKSGDVYKFNREPMEPGDLPEMPDELLNRLKVLFETNDKLKAILSKCKPCLRDKFKAHQKNPDVNDFHSAEGRQLTLALMADLGANGAGPDIMDLASRYIFREQYEAGRTADEIANIDSSKPWKCSTIQRELNSITLDEGLKSKCDSCPFRGRQQTNATPAGKGRKAAKAAPPKKKEDPFNIDLDELDQPEEVIKEAEEKAREILEKGAPVNFIMETVGKIHLGDENTLKGIAVSIAGQSCLNTAGLQISVSGSSGTGKSHALKAFLHLVPRRYKRETSLSTKAAYYMPLEPGLILFSDDKDPDEASEEVIKRATTNYQEYTTHVTVRDQKAQILTIPPRINWFLTSVESNVSDQLLNRQLTFSSDESNQMNCDVFVLQQREEMSGEKFALEVTPDVLACRRIFADIKEKLFKVKIPFADRIEMADKSNRRLFPMFADMIKGFAILNYPQRETDPEDGKLMANIEDFNEAKSLFESQRESLVSKLTDRERKIILCFQKKDTYTINELVKNTGLKYAQVNRALMGRKDRENGGLLEKVEGLTVTDQTTTEGDINGKRVGRRGKAFFLDYSKVDTFGLFDAEFITLKDEKN